MREIQIGADPEFFVKKKRHIISAHEFPFGTKADPQQTEHGHVQIDGIALECNVTPSKTREEFVANVRGVMNDLAKELQIYEPDGELAIKPSIFLGRAKLAALPMYASDLGCRPDFDAWTTMRNHMPNANSPIRTASGHLHISWTNGKLLTDAAHFDECVRVVRQLDYYLGMPSLLWDKDGRRRQLYGRAGAFRPKPYGVEYRVLSNAWTKTDRLIGWVFDATKRAVDNVFEQGVLLEKQFGALSRNVINDNIVDWPKKHPSVAEEVLQ